MQCSTCSAIFHATSTRRLFVDAIYSAKDSVAELFANGVSDKIAWGWPIILYYTAYTILQVWYYHNIHKTSEPVNGVHITEVIICIDCVLMDVVATVTKLIYKPCVTQKFALIQQTSLFDDSTCRNMWSFFMGRSESLCGHYRPSCWASESNIDIDMFNISLELFCHKQDDFMSRNLAFQLISENVQLIRREFVTMITQECIVVRSHRHI